MKFTPAKPPLTGNYRGTTRFNGFARVKEQAQWAIRKAKPQPVDAAVVSLHWRIPDRRRRDADNLGPTLKACLDALVAERVLADDSFRHVPTAACTIHEPNGQPTAMWLELVPIKETAA